MMILESCPFEEPVGDYSIKNKETRPGEILEHEQTNEEWLGSLSTEGKAGWLKDVTSRCFKCGEGYSCNVQVCPFRRCLKGQEYGIEQWLKEAHYGGKLQK